MTAIAPAKLESEISRIFGNYNDEVRNAATLADYLTLGMPVRITRGKAWVQAEITKIGKKSFEVKRTDAPAAEAVPFLVTKYGQIYEKGKANEIWGRHWKIDFDCARVDVIQANRDSSRARSSEALDLWKEIDQKLKRILPHDLTYDTTPEELDKLKQIQAILGA